MLAHELIPRIVRPTLLVIAQNIDERSLWWLREQLPEWLVIPGNLRDLPAIARAFRFSTALLVGDLPVAAELRSALTLLRSMPVDVVFTPHLGQARRAVGQTQARLAS